MTTDARVMEAWGKRMGKGNSGHHGLDYYEPGFKDGYEAAMAEMKKCPECEKDNELHPSMRWCQEHRPKIN